MTTDHALSFLRKHQPLPGDKDMSEEVIREFDEVLRHFMGTPDVRCVPLLLNAFGTGDGYGVYQHVEDVIVTFPEDMVIPYLKAALSSPLESVRYWNAQIAANYSSEDLIEPLLKVLRVGSFDEQFAAVTALERVLTPYVQQALQDELQSGKEPEIKDLIREVLGIGE